MFLAIQKLDVSNDIGKINTEAATMDVATVGNGKPEQHSPIAVKTKSVADTDVNAVKREEPVREKCESNGSSSPVKRKQVREKSDSETEDRGSPAKKPRSEPSEHSDKVHAVKSAKMSDEDVSSGEKTPSPKKRKQPKEQSEDEEEDEDEELERTYD